MALEDERQRQAGARIKERRQELRLRQPRVAERVGVTLRAYQAWEAGDSGVSYENLEKLAEALEADPDWILRGPREPAPDPFQPSFTTKQLVLLEAKLDLLLRHVVPPDALSEFEQRLEEIVLPLQPRDERDVENGDARDASG